MNIWKQILIAIMLLIILAGLLSLLFGNVKSKTPIRSNDRNRQANSEEASKEKERELAYEYLKAKQNIRNHFFHAEREILKNTAQANLQQNMQNQARTGYQPYSQSQHYYASDNNEPEYAEYEEI